MLPTPCNAAPGALGSTVSHETESARAASSTYSHSVPGSANVSQSTNPAPTSLPRNFVPFEQHVQQQTVSRVVCDGQTSEEAALSILRSHAWTVTQNAPLPGTAPTPDSLRSIRLAAERLYNRGAHDNAPHGQVGGLAHLQSQDAHPSFNESLLCQLTLMAGQAQEAEAIINEQKVQRATDESGAGEGGDAAALLTACAIQGANPEAEQQTHDPRRSGDALSMSAISVSESASAPINAAPVVQHRADMIVRCGTQTAAATPAVPLQCLCVAELVDSVDTATTCAVTQQDESAICRGCSTNSVPPPPAPPPSLSWSVTDGVHGLPAVDTAHNATDRQSISANKAAGTAHASVAQPSNGSSVCPAAPPNSTRTTGSCPSAAAPQSCCSQGHSAGPAAPPPSLQDTPSPRTSSPMPAGPSSHSSCQPRAPAPSACSKACLSPFATEASMPPPAKHRDAKPVPSPLRESTSRASSWSQPCERRRSSSAAPPTSTNGGAPAQSPTRTTSEPHNALDLVATQAFIDAAVSKRRARSQQRSGPSQPGSLNSGETWPPPTGEHSSSLTKSDSSKGRSAAQKHASKDPSAGASLVHNLPGSEWLEGGPHSSCFSWSSSQTQCDNAGSQAVSSAATCSVASSGPCSVTSGHSNAHDAAIELATALNGIRHEPASTPPQVSKLNAGDSLTQVTLASGVGDDAHAALNNEAGHQHTAPPADQSHVSQLLCALSQILQHSSPGAADSSPSDSAMIRTPVSNSKIVETASWPPSPLQDANSGIRAHYIPAHMRSEMSATSLVNAEASLLVGHGGGGGGGDASNDYHYRQQLSAVDTSARLPESETLEALELAALQTTRSSELSIRGRHNAPASNSASQPSQLAAASKLSGARTAQSESLAVLQMQVMSDKLQGALRQLHEERLARATAVRQEEQLRAWLHEMRAERRRLEDRLLEGSSRALQDTRADLESAVFALQGRLATAEAEATTVGAAASAQARAQDGAAAQAHELRALHQRYERQHAMRMRLEKHLKDLYRDYKMLKHASSVQSGDLTRLIAENKELCAVHGRQTDHCRALQARVDEQTSLLQSVKVSLETLHADNRKQAAELIAGAGCVTELRASERRLQDTVATCESTIAELQLQLSLAQQRSGESEQASGKATRDLETQLSVASRAHHTQAEIAELKAQQQQATCDALQLSVRQHQAQLKRMEAEAAQAEERNKDLHRSKTDLQQDLQRVKDQVSATEAQAREREQGLSLKLEASQTEAEHARQEAENAARAADRARADVATLRHELAVERQLNEEMGDVLERCRGSNGGA